MGVDAKICGLTRAADARFAASHGASWLGVVFAGGPRVVTVAQAREIVAAAGDVPVIGVFGSAPLQTILEVVAGAGLAGAQLHGESTEAVARALREHGLAVWRVQAIERGPNLGTTLTAAVREADAIVIEARVPGGSGGRGIPIPVDLAAMARQAVGHATRFVLSGGLNPDNLAEAVRVVRPDAVDVSSGVEVAPGVKDPARMARFLEIAGATPASA